MSLILEALRKMEQDRNSRRGAASDLRPEVLRYRVAAKPQRGRPYLPVALGVALLVCGVGAGFYLKGDRGATVARELAPVTLLDPAGSAAAVALPADSGLPVDAGLAPALPAERGPAEAAPVVAPASFPAPAPPEAARPIPVRQPAAAPIPARSGSPRETQSQPEPREAAVAPQAAADIAISGIAWQDERRMRRAVLNGALVGEGAEVAGARVVEIREDRVRLSRGGRIFEVQLSSSFSSR